MKENKAFGVLTAFIAVILSIAFVVVAIATVCAASVSEIIRPKNIVALVQSLDYTVLFSDSPEDSGFDQETEFEEEMPALDSDVVIEDDAAFGDAEAEIMDALMKSDAAKDLLNEYVSGIGSVFTGEEAPEGLTAEKLKNIVNENMDEIVGIAKEYSDEDVSEEEIRTMIEQAVDESADEIVASLPTVDEVKKEFEDDILKLLGKIFVPRTTYALIAFSVVFALLIYACRYKRFGGFMWVGVDCIIAGCFVALIKGAFSVAEAIVADMLGAESIDIVTKILSMMSKTFTVGLVVLWVAAIVLITLCIILRKVAKEKTVSEGDLPVAEPDPIANEV